MMVLDTNVLSELMKAAPSKRVSVWLGKHPASSLFSTTVTFAEILYGVALLAKGKRRRALEEAVHAMFEEDLHGRVLSFDSASARSYAEIVARRRRTGRPIAQMDAQIAAIAHSRGAALVTRNVVDFVDCGIELFDPWTA